MDYSNYYQELNLKAFDNIIYIPTATTSTTTVKTQVTKPKIQITSAQTLPSVKMEISDNALKRKREEEDYDVS